MSIDAAFTVATWALRANQAAIRTVGENVASAETPGYTAKTLPRSSVVADGALLGVRTEEIRRNVDRFLQDEVWSQKGRMDGLAMRERMLAGVEAAHGDPELGDSLGGLVGRLADGFTALAVDPSDASRQFEVVQDAELLAGRINQVGDAIQTARQDSHSQLGDSVLALNRNMKELARLNDQVRKLTMTERSTATVEDSRDQVMTEIASLTGAGFLRQPDGTVTPVLAGGFVVAPHEDVDLFALGDATVGAQAFYGPGGSIPALTLTLPGTPTVVRDVTTRMTGGTMGALIELRDETLALQQAELDEFAHKLARRFEQQGLSLFTDGNAIVPNEASPALAPGAPVQTNYLGFGTTIQVNEDVRNDPRLVRDGTHAVPGALIGPTGSAFTPNPPGGPEGFTTLIERIAVFTFGDEIDVGVAHDPAFQSTGLGGTGALAGEQGDPRTLSAYAARVTASAADLRNATTTAKQNVGATYELVSNRLADESGVSVDKEMSQLIELQNSYSANARVITTLQAMWDALFASVR